MSKSKKETTEKFVVIKKHCLNHKVGAVIELTEKQAKSLVGKVRLQSEEIDESEFAEVNGQLQAENDSLKKENEELKGDSKKLNAEITLLAKKDK